MAHITLLAYTNCSTTGISGPIDAFSIANLWHRFGGGLDETCAPLFGWDIVTINGEPVQGHGRVAIQPHGSIHAVDATDFILIPGSLPPLEFIGNVPEELKTWLRSWHDKKTLIGSTCTGAFLLAETGLLDGKIATTNWLFARYFKKLYPNVRLKPERILTVDGGLICSGATTAYLDLCLYLIEKFGSEELSARCSKSLLVDPSRRSSFTVKDLIGRHNAIGVKLNI
jgi:transcriptional regulator GlxA family with amidase domain